MMTGRRKGLRCQGGMRTDRRGKERKNLGAEELGRGGGVGHEAVMKQGGGGEEQGTAGREREMRSGKGFLALGCSAAGRRGGWDHGPLASSRSGSSPNGAFNGGAGPLPRRCCCSLL